MKKFHPRPKHPYVERNPFRQQTARPVEIPTYSAAQAALPEPILPDHPEWVALYWRAWEIVWANLKQVDSNNGFIASYLASTDADPLHMWDSVIYNQIGVYGRYVFDFMGSVDNLYASQKDDGFICQAIDIQSGQDLYYPFDPNGTGPNLLACNEWRNFRLTGEDSRLPRVFWLLLALHHWYRDNRSWPNGTFWATGVSSHLENQPRVPDSRDHHRHWAWVDATVQAALNVSCLAQMAAHIGEQDLSVQLQEECQQLQELINKTFWNEETQFYQDVDPYGRFSRVKSAAAYWALLDPGLVPENRIGPFIQPLRENWAFNLPHRIPSMSADSEGYHADTGKRWRGGVWPCLNFMLLRGLRFINQNALAHEIAVNHLRNMHKVYLDTGYFWDHYAPEVAAPGEGARKDALTACVTPIAALMEDVIGISVDWPQRRLFWDRRLASSQPYGVRNYPLGDTGVLEMTGDKEKIIVTTNTPFTLVTRDASQSLQTAVNTGTTVIELQ